MKELTCALTLTLVSLVAASPHGYGVKGGATAKAEASALAGGLSSLPLSIPSGSSFSGSFSKSASTGFASSSASSSSSSFSYSGSGSSGITGFGTKNDGGCSTGGCAGGAGTANSQGLNGFGANGFGAHGGANAAAAAGASALAGSPGSSKDSSLTCTSGECSNQPSGNPNSEAHLVGGEKTYLELDSAAGSGASGNGANNKCTSGKCGLTGQTGTTAPDYQSASQFGVPSLTYSPGNNCAFGKCGSSQPEVPASNYEPSSDCASGKCGSTSQPSVPSSNYGPSGDCASGKCGSGSQSGTPSSNYGSNSDCASGQCGQSSSPESSSYDYGHQGAASPSTNHNNCQSGQCEPNTLTGPASPNYDTNDILVIASGTTPKSTQGFKEKPSNYGKISADCSFGNCGQSTSSNSKPSYPDSSSTPYQNANLAYQNQGASNFGYNPTALGNGLASGYNKPATHLTTPKQGSSYTPSNTYDSGHVHTPSDGNMCTGGKCDVNSSKGPFTSTDLGAKCTSSNCASNTYNNEKTPSYSGAPGYQVPTGSVSLTGSPNCASGNCATYPSAQPSIGFSSVSAGQYKPSYSHNQASQQTPLGPTGSAGFPSTPSSNGYPTVPKNPTQSGLPSFTAPSGSDSTNCKTPNCATYPSTNINTAVGANIQTGVQSLVDVSKPATTDQKLPVYTGGFGGPAGILKPNEFGSVPTGITKPAYPHSPLNHHVPTGATGILSHHTGFGTSPIVFNNPSVTHPGVPAHNTPIGSDSTNCKTPNCGSYPSAGGVTTAGSSSHQGVPAYNTPTGSDSTDCKTPNCGSYPSAGGVSPAGGSSYPGIPSHNTPTGSYSTHCNTPNCGSYPSAGGVATASGSSHPGVPAYNTPTGSDSTNCKTPNCGSYPSAGGVTTAGASAGGSSPSGVSSPVDSSKPSSPDQKLPVYTGGFGGAAGFLKPNDYSFSSQVPASHSYNKPSAPPGTYNPATCTSGNCGSQPLLPHLHGSSSNVAPASATAVASANAEADAVAYTGGFGGPPGLLKPYDDGKLSSSDLIKHSPNSQFGIHQGVSSSGIHSSYGSDSNKYDAGSQAGGNAVAGAQASAIAGASSGAVSGSNPHGYGSQSGHDHKGPGGCGGGCGLNAAGSYSGSGQIGYNSGLSLAKLGHHEGSGSSLSGSGSVATAKSLAGAVSGTNAFGTSGSFASSSATAHASAGAGTKGSYYGR